MLDDPTAALREQARERGRRLLAAPPFESIADRTTLLLTSPPADDLGDAAFAPAVPAFWMLVDPALARALPDPYRSALQRDGVYVARERARGPGDALDGYDLTITIDATTTFEGVARRTLESRWAVRHAQVVHDRMGRHAQLIAAAGRYPQDVPERITRALWLQLVAAVRALWVIGVAPAAAALPAAGEAAAALCRLACVHDEGDHPTLDLLVAVARGTRIGKRVATWLDDLAAALGGDAAATRRVLAAADQVLREVAGVLGELYRDRPWLRDPEAYALRPSR